MVSLIVCRYVVFATFVVLNALICSLAAWNLGVARSAGLTSDIDAFLIFFGIFGILLIFPIVCIEQVRKGAVTSRVWFEAVWVGLFWVFNLSGAAATTVFIPDLSCDLASPGWTMDRCTSTKAVVAFLWISMIAHLVYLVTLVVIAIMHTTEDSNVWQSGVADYAWFEKASRHKRMASPDVEAQLPNSFRPLYTSTTAYTAQRPDMHPQAQFQFPQQAFQPYKEKELPVQPATSFARQASYDAPLPPRPTSQPSRYPAVLGPGIPATPHKTQTANQPAPAGQWPRLEAAEQSPMTPGRRGGASHGVSPSLPAQVQRPPPAAIAKTAPPARRTRSGGGSVARHRPPPLDLSSISNS